MAIKALVCSERDRSADPTESTGLKKVEPVEARRASFHDPVDISGGDSRPIRNLVEPVKSSGFGKSSEPSRRARRNSSTGVKLEIHFLRGPGGPNVRLLEGNARSAPWIRVDTHG
jgi:hypothetical protein